MSENNQITGDIIGAAIEVHKRLGPGLLESAYRVCLAYELRKRDLAVAEGKQFPSSTMKSNWSVDSELTWSSTTKSWLS